MKWHRQRFLTHRRAALALTASLVACSGDKEGNTYEPEANVVAVTPGPAWQPPPSHWPNYANDPGGSRYSPLDQLQRDNVDRLQIAWIFRTGELGQDARDGGDLTFETTPVHFEGTLYLTTGFNQVIALDPVTGREIWRFDSAVDRQESFSEVTNRGVATWRNPEAVPTAVCAARIYTGTIDGRLIALDAASGRPCPSFGDEGEVALWQLAGVEAGEVGDYQVTSAPVVVGDRVVVGPSIGDNWNVDTGDGSVRAFGARTGELAWEWMPLEDREPGQVGAGNAWSTMAADPQRGLVFVPTGSASPDFFGGLRPGNNQWANSVVALDVATGRQIWGFQTVHHDLFDYDVAAQPTLATIRHGNEDVPVVIQATKIGHVFVLDRETGTPLFEVEERTVPGSQVPGEHASSTQPFPLKIAPLIDDQGVDPEHPWGLTDAHKAACARLARGFRFEGPFTPPSLQGSVLFPGNGAGTNWGSAALEPESGLLLVPTSRFATLVRLAERENVEQVVEELSASGWENLELSRQRGAPYEMARQTWIADGVPCTPPPFGALTAVDLHTGDVRWEVTLGETETGTPAAGGPIVTAGGLAFMAGTPDRKVRAYDSATGEVLWRAELPRAALSTPMTYLGSDGRQYLVVTAGGHGKWGLETGDYVVAFALAED